MPVDFKRTSKASRMAAIDPKPKTPFTEVELPILAAIFARSNMGMGRPEPEKVAKAMEGYHQNGRGTVVHMGLQQAVVHFCHQYMENDTDIEGFVAEAQVWVDQLRRDGKEQTCRVHPEICELMFSKSDPHVRLGYHEQANRRALREKRQSRGRGRK